MGHEKANPIGPRATTLRLAVPLIACLALCLSTEARAQVAAPGGMYGGYGWGGWGAGGTVPGNTFRGMGAFAQGLGAGDLQSAQAGAVRTETFMALNEYMYRSAQEYRQRAAARRRASDERADEARDEIRDRRVNEPTPVDIESGDALNNLLFEIDNPGIPDSVVRDSADGISLPGSAVQKIPFKFSHQGVAVSIRRLNSEGPGWPPALQHDQLSPLRDRYDEIVDEILEVPDGESVPNDLIDEARSILGQMYEAIQQAGLPGPEAAEALRHLKAQAGMVQMLQQVEVKQVLDEAANVDEVTLPTLLNFMRVFNLQFGSAENAEEKALYSQELYPRMAQLHDSLKEQYGGDLPGAAGSEDEEPVGSPADAFEGFDLEQLGLPGGDEEPRTPNRGAPEGTLDDPSS